MRIKQISVFLENKAGRLALVTGILSDNGISIRALSIADTTNFGILRLIVDEPEKAEKVLGDAGLAVKATDVIAISLPDETGALGGAMKLLDNAGIGVSYMYAYLGKEKENAFIAKVSDFDGAIRALADGGIRVMDSDEVYRA